MGSAGVKAMAVVTGEADIYAHSGGQYVWDSAAPVAVAGLPGCTLRAWTVRRWCTTRSPWLPDLLICRPELTEHGAGVVRRSQREHGGSCIEDLRARSYTTDQRELMDAAEAAP